MAKMYPNDIHIDKPSAPQSEKFVFDLFKNELGKEYEIYYSVSWSKKEDGKEDNSECDFLIFNKNYGFLTCEVKGGSGLKYENGKFILIDKKNGDRELSRSPIQQSEDNMYYFKKLYEETYKTHFPGVYGAIAFFPHYVLNDPVLLDHRDKTVILDASDIKNISERIADAFLYFMKKGKKCFITTSEEYDFKCLLINNIASKDTSSSIIDAKERELSIVNRVQDNLVYFLDEYNKAFIKGGAGTGKSWIAYKLAKKSLLLQKSVMIIFSCHNLKSFYADLLPDYEKLTICTFDEMVKTDFSSYAIDSSSEQLFELYVNNDNFKKYDCIIVDEGQDFDQYQAGIINMHLNDINKSELKVFYDPTQNIFNKDFKDGFNISDKPFNLKENLRNTSSIYEWSTKNTKLGTDVITNSVIGPTPIESKFDDDYEVLNFIETKLLRFIDNDGNDNKSIVILADHECYNKLVNKPIGRWVCVDKKDINYDEIRITKVEDFKGLESEVVFYWHSISTPDEYDYVAYTRAKYYLFNLISK